MGNITQIENKINFEMFQSTAVTNYLEKSVVIFLQKGKLAEYLLHLSIAQLNLNFPFLTIKNDNTQNLFLSNSKSNDKINYELIVNEIEFLQKY